MHFHRTHTSLIITRAEENKGAQMKVEVGVRLTLEARRSAEEEEEYAWLESEEEACLVEDARLKAKEEDQVR